MEEGAHRVCEAEQTVGTLTHCALPLWQWPAITTSRTSCWWCLSLLVWVAAGLPISRTVTPRSTWRRWWRTWRAYTELSRVCMTFRKGKALSLPLTLVLPALGSLQFPPEKWAVWLLRPCWHGGPGCVILPNLHRSLGSCHSSHTGKYSSPEQKLISILSPQSFRGRSVELLEGLELPWLDGLYGVIPSSIPPLDCFSFHRSRHN